MIKMTTKTKAKEETTVETEYRPCACGLYRVDIPQETGTRFDVKSLPRKQRDYLDTPVGDEAGWVYLETLCTATTQKTFAPGHDARFAGLMQVALVTPGAMVSDNAGHGYTDPLALVREVAPGLVWKVEAAKDRKPKAPRKTSTKGKGKTVTAKVGRWEREGYVDTEGTFVYTDKSGKTSKAFDGHYTLVA